QPLAPAYRQLLFDSHRLRIGPRYREFHPAIRCSFPHPETRRLRHPFRGAGRLAVRDAGEPDEDSMLAFRGVRTGGIWRRGGGSTWNDGSTRVELTMAVPEVAQAPGSS